MDLTSRLQNFFSGRKNQPKQVQPTESFGNKLVRGIGQSPIGKALVNIQKSTPAFQQGGVNAFGVQAFQNNNRSVADYVPQFQARPNAGIVEKIKVGAMNLIPQTGANIVGRGIVDPALDLANIAGSKFSGKTIPTYSNLKSPLARLEYNALGQNVSPQQILGNAAGVALPVLDAWGGGKLVSTGVNATKTALKGRTLLTTLKPQLKEGLITGTSYGAASGLAENRNEELLTQLLSAVGSGVFGGTVGVGLGGLTGTGGYVSGKTVQRLREVLGQNGIRGKDADVFMKGFARDEMGRFVGKKAPVESKTPIGLFNNMLDPKYAIRRDKIYADLRKALYLPDDYQSGFIKPSEFMPNSDQMKGKVANAGLDDITLQNSPNPVQPPEFIPSKAPGIRDDSVIDDIQGGFDSGRKARQDAEARNFGDMSLKLRSEGVDRISAVHDSTNLMGKDLPADKNPYKQMRMIPGTDGRVEAYIEKNVKPIINQEKDRLDDLSTLWVLEKEMELVTKRGLKRKRTEPEIQQGINELRAKYGDDGLRTLQESTTKLRTVGDDLLNQLTDAGIISKESRDVIKKNNEFWAPFEAVEHMADNIEKGNGTGSYNVASQDVIKKIGDYEGDVGNPLDAFMRKIPKVIRVVEKNKAIQSYVNLRNERPEIYKDVIVPLGGNETPVDMGVINVFENGENKRYGVPEVIATAIKNMDGKTGGILVDISSWQAKILQAGATGLNAAFIPVNIARDVQDALTTEFTEKGARAMMQFLGSYPRAIFSAWRKDDLYNQWLASGGGQSSMTEQLFKNTPKTIDELAGKIPLKTRLNPIKNTVGLIKFANRVGEQSTRLARFRSGLTRGESIQEAAYKSRDISLDFSKAGNSTKVLNRAIPFLTAAINGTEKLMRLYKTNPKRAIATTGIVFGTPTLLLYSHNSQFQDYDDIPDVEKQDNWILLARDRTEEEKANGDSPIGFKIPKGFLGRIVSTSVESGLEFIEKRDPGSLANAFLDTAESISPVGLPVSEDRLRRTISKVSPPGLRAAYEWTSNTNTYFGNKIVPQGLENLPASEQYKEKTPGIYKAAGKLTGLSPLKLENTVNTMTGGLGRQLATAFSGDVKGGTVDQISRRFMDIRDGKKANDTYEMVDKEKEYSALRNKQLKEAFRDGNMEEVKRLSEGMSSQQINSLIRSDFKKQQKETLTPEQKALESLSKEERARLLKDRPELKTELDIVSKAGAAENKPYDFAEQVATDAEEATVKLEVETTGKPKKFNDTYYYINEKGNVATIDMNMKPELPEMTGDATLDKELKKDYQSDISTKQNNVLKLLKQGAITKEKAADLYQRLEDLRSTSGGGSGKGRKTAKIDYTQFAKAFNSVRPIRVQVSKGSSGSAKKFSAPKVSKPQVKELKFKGKPIRLKKKA